MTYFIIVIKHHARERERHYFIIFIKHHARERERYCLRCLFLELFERLIIGSVPSALLSDAAGICQRPAAAPVFSSQNLLIIFIFIILIREREVLFDVCRSHEGVLNTPFGGAVELAPFDDLIVTGGVHSACTYTNLSHSRRIIFSATIYSQ